MYERWKCTVYITLQSGMGADLCHEMLHYYIGIIANYDVMPAYTSMGGGTLIFLNFWPACAVVDNASGVVTLSCARFIYQA